MNEYDVNVSISVMPKQDNEGWSPNHGLISLSNRFTIKGENFTSIGPRLDAVIEAMRKAAEGE